MNYLDVVLAVPLIWGIYKGFSKGLIIEVASLLALALGIYGGLKFSGFAADWLTAHGEFNKRYVPLASFAITFAVIVLGVYAFAKLLEKIVNIVSLKLINKLAGAVFGVLKIAVILSVLLLLFDTVDKKLELIPSETKTSSILYRPIKSLAPAILPMLKETNWLEWQNEESQEVIALIPGSSFPSRYSSMAPPPVDT
ncbi:MAG: colicin V production protein [Flavobacteriales bacterium]|nr:MAG: colicin V production protein [Flavobacteriales bacterium]